MMHNHNLYKKFFKFISSVSASHNNAEFCYVLIVDRMQKGGIIARSVVCCRLHLYICLYLFRCSGVQLLTAGSEL